ncbi:glycoside hydrolase family 2 protein [Halegenticoccus soli]|uniref:glycoside hydrolase family 2 protein n=1 Tax=Halegenticoccus soli TaxID=1985678 RepID=UPI000C6DEC0F|nr:sugar-binding domain-containing protein [Halegenticoccus soli]
MSRRQRLERNERRSPRSLNGRWEFSVDPDGAGEADGWHRPGASWPSETRDVSVPHAWQELDGLRDYAGIAWYRRTFDAADAPGARRYLRFGAVDYEATVWLNGTRLGEHRDGYLPFEFDATDALRDGENVLVVRVVDPEDLSEIPHGKQGEPWYTRVSGIWQDVSLETRPETHVVSIRATPDLTDDAVEIEASVRTSDGVDPRDVDAAVIVEREGAEVARNAATPGSDGTATATVNLDDPDYWTPETPALYDVRVVLEADGETVDEARDYFGMRSVDAEGGRLYLNGEPLYVRGALDQAYYPDTLYRPFDDDLFEREIRTAKELGFNLLRKHIKPAHPDFLELADRLGILVWEEPANPSVCTERSKAAVRDQIRGLIERDYNRPSVVVWSLYNEEWGIGNPQGLAEETSLWEDEEKQAYLAELYEEAKGWDPTRLVCDNSGWAHVATDLNDYHRYFVAPDRADAWSDDLDRIVAAPEDNYGATETDPGDAPILVSEFGTWGLCDVPAIEERYGGDPPWFSHDFLDEQLKRPEGVEERFESTDLSAVFGDFDALAETWQGREFVSIKRVIEEMRAREGIAGYVLTEFSDIEWEFNGILDYFREEKSFHDEFASVNGALAVRLDPRRRATWAGESLSVDAAVFNDTGEPLSGTLTLSAFGATESREVDVDGFGATRVDSAFRIDVPDAPAARIEEVELELDAPAASAKTAEAVAVVPRAEAEVEADAKAVYADSSRLADRLGEFGYPVAASPADADVAVVSTLSERIEEHVRAGKPAVLVPNEEGHMEPTDAVEYRELPETESWNLVASLFYHDSELLDGISVDRRPGWAFEGLYPYEVATGFGGDESIEVGYVEGWLANWSSPLVRADVGDGPLRICTFRVTERYGDQPVGTLLLNRLINDL